MKSVNLAKLGIVNEHGEVLLTIDSQLLEAKLVDVIREPALDKPLAIIRTPSGDLRACYYQLNNDNGESVPELAPMSVDAERAALVVYSEHKRPKAS